ncbi:NHL repeat-containing protein [Variovorax guangxiensis]|uniref:NHL repeat-containing protein n=1 Tax=Variovorax guangxiensis TaxID=1775474 RepID=UPI0028650E14|nr:NHL repeat-containing protein [Variovorax guangxiensis]MDR6854658.1 sugar lactone lactonase YvrE [Variovorax guangxiensis]
MQIPPAGDTAPAQIPPAGDTAPPTYAIGGTLTGLADNIQLVLLDNGGDALTLVANGAFRFAAPVAFNTAYAVTVGKQPLWQNCSVSNGSGTATADVNSVQVNCVEAQAQVSTLAGSAAAGFADGTGDAAQFNGPSGMAVDSSGNVYMADYYNNRIRKITPAGVVTTWAGSGTAGFADDTGAAAQFNGPTGMAVDPSGNVYVADNLNHKIRKITPAGVVTTLAGSGTAGSADGPGTTAQFNYPGGIAIDASGNVYVANDNTIRKITSNGVVTTLAGSTTSGSTDGAGPVARFNGPYSLTVDTSGNVYVADTVNHMIRKITPAGVVTRFAESGTTGSADGASENAQFNFPSSVAVDISGNVYVAELGNNAIRKITPAGAVTTLAGSGRPGFADGIGASAQFDNPWDVELDASGNLYIATYHAIRKITPVR